MRYFSLFLLSVFLIPIIQTANAQTIPGQNGEANGNLPVVASKYMNNTSVGQAGLIQNNPGYTVYIPGSGFLNNTPNNTGHENLKNITNGHGQASTNARISMSNAADKSGLVQNNPGYAKYIPGSGFLNNTVNKNTNVSGVNSNASIFP